ncbi:MAG: transcriptional regulator, XRE family [Nitrospira sp.]|jgi:transcriptional regulator with XRE-family HTH domain|nr:MAG: transcriptional regulator, XRE family [Nitrospira sp.]
MRNHDFRAVRSRITASVGESVRIVRELQEMIQSESARLTGIPQSIISTIENNSVNLGVERAKVLARALRCHPAVLIFSGWDIHKPSGA